MTDNEAAAIAALNQTLRAQITRMDAAFAKVEVLAQDIKDCATAIHELNATLSETVNQ